VAKKNDHNLTNQEPGYFLVGGFKPLEKYESQWEGLSHITHYNPIYYGK
jgi:hypothetical protein